MTKIKVLYFLGGTHLYGDNKSLMEILKILRNEIDVCLVLKRENHKYEDSILYQLDKLNIKYVLVSSVFSIPKLKLNENLSLKYLKNWGIFIVASLKASITIFKCMLDFKPNIVHSNNGMMFGGFVFSKIFRIPHVWHLREFIDLDHGYKIFPSKPYFIKLLNKSFCITNSKGVSDHFNRENRKSIVVYNPSGLSVKNFIVKENYILYVGRIIESKGIFDLIKVFNEFVKIQPDAILKIVGGFNRNDSFKLKLDAFIEVNNLNYRIEFLGFRNDVGELMSRAKCLVVPSYYEAFGRITIEALYSGCIVVGRNTGGTRELINLCNNGFLFENEKDCLDLIKKVWTINNNEYYKFINSCQNSAIDFFKPEYVAEKVLSYYYKIDKKLPLNHES